MSLNGSDPEPSGLPASPTPLSPARESHPAPAAVDKVSLIQGQIDKVAGVEIYLHGSETHSERDPGL